MRNQHDLAVDRSARTGVIGQCVWGFAASNEELHPSTGEFSVQPQTWTCQSPLASGTTMASLLTALSGTSPLYATLPGTSTTIHDGLVPVSGQG